MQAFGILGLIIVIALAAWWLIGAPTASDSEPSGTSASFQGSIESAEEAADLLSN